MDRDIIGIIIGFILFFLIACFMGYQYEKFECSAKAKTLGYKCEYSFITGCVLEKPNGKKMLLEQLRDFDN